MARAQVERAADRTTSSDLTSTEDTASATPTIAISTPPQTTAFVPPATATNSLIPSQNDSEKDHNKGLPTSNTQKPPGQSILGDDKKTFEPGPPVRKSPATSSTAGTVSSPTQSHDSTSSSPSTVPIGVLIGAVLAAVVLSMGAALLVCYFRVLRRRRVARLAQPMTTSTDNGVPSQLLLPRQTMVPYIFFNANSVPENMTSAEFMAAMQQHGLIANGGQINLAAATPQQGMDLLSGQMGNGKTGRRAVDAGPVVNDADDEDEVESTLPPGYRDVFDMSRSATVSSRS